MAPAEFRRLATWQWDEARASYVRRLTAALLRRYPSFFIETAVLIYDLRHPLHRVKSQIVV